MTLTFWRRWQVETFGPDGRFISRGEQRFTLGRAYQVATFTDFMSGGRYRSLPVRATAAKGASAQGGAGC